MSEPSGSVARGPDDSERKSNATRTSNFGARRRESHDASPFYARFTTPEINDDRTINDPGVVDQILVRDARDLSPIADNSVALVVTSPPYFVGKEYEEALGEGHIPSTYIEYLEMLRDVFAECVRVLEPGGRIAVNVANLGRKPYRSLSADVIRILQDELRMLLRGEIIWVKAKGASGSCAWGSFQQPRNPVIRDLTERVIIASKGRFDRAWSAAERSKKDFPSVSTVSRDEFMEATTDLWELPTESATRIGHPAPFPVELPERLIQLYTYEDDIVLDPFMGSGSTAVAAVRTGRHYVGIDTDPAYASLAEQRIRDEYDRMSSISSHPSTRLIPGPSSETLLNPVHEAMRIGLKADEVAILALQAAGFTDLRSDVRVAPGVVVDAVALDAGGSEWYFDISGGFTTQRSGLTKTETLLRTIGEAAIVHGVLPDARLVLLSSDVPRTGHANIGMLRAVMGPGAPVFDAISLRDDADLERLAAHATAPAH